MTPPSRQPCSLTQVLGHSHLRSLAGAPFTANQQEIRPEGGGWLARGQPRRKFLLPETLPLSCRMCSFELLYPGLAAGEQEMRSPEHTDWPGRERRLWAAEGGHHGRSEDGSQILVQAPPGATQPPGQPQDLLSVGSGQRLQVTVTLSPPFPSHLGHSLSFARDSAATGPSTPGEHPGRPAICFLPWVWGQGTRPCPGCSWCPVRTVPA